MQHVDTLFNSSTRLTTPTVDHVTTFRNSYTAHRSQDVAGVNCIVPTTPYKFELSQWRHRRHACLFAITNLTLVWCNRFVVRGSMSLRCSSCYWHTREAVEITEQLPWCNCGLLSLRFWYRQYRPTLTSTETVDVSQYTATTRSAA